MLGARKIDMVGTADWQQLEQAVAEAAAERCLVDTAFACPNCGEQDMDMLVWLEDDRVDCQSCGHAYDPSA